MQFYREIVRFSETGASGSRKMRETHAGWLGQNFPRRLLTCVSEPGAKLPPDGVAFPTTKIRACLPSGQFCPLSHLLARKIGRLPSPVATKICGTAYAQVGGMKTLFSSVVGMLLLSSMVCIPGESQKIRSSVASLDDTYRRADLKKVVPKLAELVKVERAIVEKAMVDKQQKFSSIVFAKLIADKSGKDIATILFETTDPDWVALLKAAGLKDDDVVEHLDGLQSELAFAMLDFRTAKR